MCFFVLSFGILFCLLWKNTKVDNKNNFLCTESKIDVKFLFCNLEENCENVCTWSLIVFCFRTILLSFVWASFYSLNRFHVQLKNFLNFSRKPYYCSKLIIILKLFLPGSIKQTVMLKSFVVIYSWNQH